MEFHFEMLRSVSHRTSISAGAYKSIYASFRRQNAPHEFTPNVLIWQHLALIPFGSKCVLCQRQNTHRRTRTAEHTPQNTRGMPLAHVPVPQTEGSLRGALRFRSDVLNGLRIPEQVFNPVRVDAHLLGLCTRNAPVGSSSTSHGISSSPNSSWMLRFDVRSGFNNQHWRVRQWHSAFGRRGSVQFDDHRPSYAT